MQQLVERDNRPARIKTTPYWWEDVPRPAPTAGALPKSVDVLVIGSGYTGLSAARETARGRPLDARHRCGGSGLRLLEPQRRADRRPRSSRTSIRCAAATTRTSHSASAARASRASPGSRSCEEPRHRLRLSRGRPLPRRACREIFQGAGRGFQVEAQGPRGADGDRAARRAAQGDRVAIAISAAPCSPSTVTSIRASTMPGS